jgi:hypothetical protein
MADICQNSLHKPYQTIHKCVYVYQPKIFIPNNNNRLETVFRVSCCLFVLVNHVTSQRLATYLLVSRDQRPENVIHKKVQLGPVLVSPARKRYT